MAALYRFNFDDIPIFNKTWRKRQFTLTNSNSKLKFMQKQLKEIAALIKYKSNLHKPKMTNNAVVEILKLFQPRFYFEQLNCFLRKIPVL